MLDEKAGPATAEDYVQLVAAGARAKGAYRCADCRYGVAVWKELPRCPMCGGEAWEQSEWSPLSRARELL